jgi:Zn-dependent protease with chaperone function
LQTLEAKRSRVVQFPFNSFLEWYAPYFNATTFILARAHEYEADAASAELMGVETA